MEMYIVFGPKIHGQGTTLTHVTIDGARTLCGKLIPPEWYPDDWADGPECKTCKAAAQRIQSNVAPERKRS